MRQWNRSITSLLGMGALVLAVSSVEAHPVNTYRGFDNNAITKKEAKKLAKHRKHLVRVRDRALRDGYVTRKEAKKINKAQHKVTRYQTQATGNYANRDYPWSWDAWRNWRNWWNGDRFDNRRDDRYDQGRRWDGNRGRSRWYAEGDQQGWYNNGHNHHRHHDDQDRQRQHDHHDHRGWKRMHERQR